MAGPAACCLPTLLSACIQCKLPPIAGAIHRFDHIYGIARLDSGKVSAGCYTGVMNGAACTGTHCMLARERYIISLRTCCLLCNSISAVQGPVKSWGNDVRFSCVHASTCRCGAWTSSSARMPSGHSRWCVRFIGVCKQLSEQRCSYQSCSVAALVCVAHSKPLHRGVQRCHSAHQALPPTLAQS